MNEPPKTSALLKDLRERGQLPALDENIATLCSLAGDPMACAAELTSVILRDAALTANVLSVANSAAFGPAEPVKTVSAAILLMGFERVRCLATGLGILRQLDRDPKNRQLYRLVASSYFAGLFAMALGRELGDTNAEELLVVGVLSQLPRLLLAHAFPDRYAEVEAQLQTGRLTLDQACRDVFGVGYREVAGEVAQFWNLPEPVAKAVRGEPRTDALGTVLRESARLADLLFGHNATATDSMATSERRLRQALNKPDFKLNPFITRTCEEDPNVARFFRLGPGDIARMIENAGSGRSPAPAPPTPPPAGPDSARPAEAPPEPGVLIGHYLTDLMVSIRRGADINRILLTALEAIFRCVRSECVVLAFRDMSRSTLTGRFHLSSLPRFRATDFRIELSGTPSPLARALTQRQTVQLRARQEMPDSWLERTGLDGVLAVPIEVRGNAVGLCVVGRRDPALFSEQEQVWIEAVVGHVVTAFERVRPK